MACSTRGLPSTSSTLRAAGSMWRNSPGSVCRAISASVPAISTPVGPPPMTTKVSHGARRAGSAPSPPLRRPAAPAADLEGVVQGLEAGREAGPLVAAEVAVRGAGGHDQVVVAVGAVARCTTRAGHRCGRPRRAAWSRWPACGTGGAPARRWRAPTGPPWPPGRAAAGTGGGWCLSTSVMSTSASCSAGRFEPAEAAADDQPGPGRAAFGRRPVRAVHARCEPDQVAPGAHQLVLRDRGAAPARAGLRAFRSAFFYLFNSYYEALGPRHPRPQRGC
jgi:hypothetical protein